MNWKLFLDDERFPKDSGWLIARTSDSAIQMVLLEGMPQEISFDHDLGGDDTSMAFLHWLTQALIKKQVSFPVDFVYSVHSQNPVGGTQHRRPHGQSDEGLRFTL